MPDFSSGVSSGIQCAADILRESRHAVVLTGAGISTPSGIPDFRSTHSGLWERYDPYEVASLNAFRYHPEKFFDWIRPLTRDLHNAQPNEAHKALAQLEQAGFIKTVITQNIDGLHQRAGSQNVIEVHGSLDTLTCVSCYQKYPAERYEVSFLENGEIPRCPECGHILKPDAVLFGEQLPVHAWLKAEKASKTCDLMIVAGSSLEVLPVAGLPMRAVENGAHLVLINQSETYIDVRADIVFYEDVIDVIPRLLRAVMGDSGKPV
jgi:NAD-dependent deacetylase